VFNFVFVFSVCVSEASYRNKERGIHAFFTFIVHDNPCYNVVLIWFIDKGSLCGGKLSAKN
jgi:hypothetical protein